MTYDTKGKDKLPEFILFVSLCHQTIKFTAKIWEKEISFLHTLMKILENVTSEITWVIDTLISHKAVM